MTKLDSLSDRISYVIQTSGMTKTAFAKKINVSQSLISMIASGSASPSDRTIMDICREFHIDEVWLRTGEGDMFLPAPASEDVFTLLSALLAGKTLTLKIDVSLQEVKDNEK